MIETRGLTKRFGRIRAVEDLDLTVPHGSLFGFLGPNGAGKSTTIRMLTGLIRPTSGEASVLGVPIRQRLRLGGRLGALIEEPAFYPWLSGRRNLRLLTSLSGGVSLAEIDETLELVGLGDAADRAVGGYSHGMRQRLGIAQALLPRPELLILDEPASGLDPEGLAQVREMLLALHEEGMTVFLSSHLLAEVEMTCTHVAVVMAGQVIAQGEVGGMLDGLSPGTRMVVDDVPASLTALSTLEGVEAEPTGDGALRITGALDSATLNEALVSAGVRVSEITPVRRTLESFYMDTVRQNGLSEPQTRAEDGNNGPRESSLSTKRGGG
ncbi:MAG: ATP-binding cassette domain-containing protein [Armatimonadia bacterium]|nr:ATP-binding cassette domain-containing protein [Armatimonadia bacterium]